MADMKALRSYPKVWNLGHPNIANLFDGPVVVQEKVDGSQFSFGVVDGVLHCRSKGATVHLTTEDKLFRAAVDTAMRLHDAGKLVEGYVYRGEVLHAPKHNTLAYGRVPAGNVILFDVDTGYENRVGPEELFAFATHLGLECVPTFHVGPMAANADGLALFRSLLENESVLGAVPIEGVVIKNYGRFGDDGKMLMGKYVSEAFKESHTKDWRKRNPTRTDIVEAIIARYATERRWEKAIERLRDAGKLEYSPRDIGQLMREVPADVREECAREIADALFSHHWPAISRGITRGLPEWYKQRLMESQFAGVET